MEKVEAESETMTTDETIMSSDLNDARMSKRFKIKFSIFYFGANTDKQRLFHPRLWPK